MGTSMTFAGLVVLAVIGVGAFLAFKLIQGIVWLLLQLFAGLGGFLKAVWLVLRRVFRHIGGFTRDMAVDGLHTLGAGLTAGAIIPLSLGNLLIGRWSSARHYGTALQDEVASVGLGLYRLAIGHPLRCLGLKRLVEGIEQRVPEVIERAPRARSVRGEFPGYEVFGTLPTGGSGAHLFVARPLAETFQRFHTLRRPLADEVVIKSFALEQGSTLPQIVRESRALEAAGKLGLVYEHHLSPERFYYVMPYVKGRELDREIHRLHARSNPEGLGAADLMLVTGYAIDVLAALERFHTGGLWHKDVKPANLIVEKGRVHLVDFGLVSSLASALTLTTHGTEYYRDPEMVRLAMQGVKVHEVDGVRFDIYSTGAVLYSMVENSFPAHGSLSKVTRRCPEALRWIINRAMADLRTRYGSAREMREDLLYVARSSDPFAVRPGELPSFTGESMPDADLPPQEELRPAPPVMAQRAQDDPKRAFPYKYHDPAGTQAPAFSGAAAGMAAGASSMHAVGGKEGRWERRRPGRFVAAAVLFFGLFAVFLWSSHREHRQAPDVVSLSLPVSPMAPRFDSERLSREDVDLINGVQRAFEDYTVEDPYLAALERRVAEKYDDAGTGVEVHAAGVAVDNASEMELLLRGGRVLILKELNSEISPNEVESLRVHLVQNGFDVISDESDEGVELEAKALKEIVYGSFDDELTHLQLQNFLSDNEGQVSAIVLLDGTSDELVYRTLGPTRF